MTEVTRKAAGPCLTWPVRLGMLLAFVAGAGALPAQDTDVGMAPPFASALVVGLHNPVDGQDGAGIVVGADATRLFIVTAAHVIRDADTVSVTFAPAPGAASAAAAADMATGTVMKATPTRLDLAVVTVPRTSARGIRVALESQDRLGNPALLETKAPVAPVGCPSGCWRISVSREQVIAVGSEELIVEAGTASNMGPGSSGGALFNRHWEVVGMVTEHEPPRGYALPIDRILQQLAFWKVPVTLRRPTFPRGGYRTTVTVSMLAPSGSDQRTIDNDRLPSGRLSVTRQTRAPWSVTISAVRLAPRDVGVSAGMAGIAATLPLGRLSLQPFAEVGLGRVEGRYDAGGVTVVSPDTVYVPRWVATQADGLGFGGGVDLQLLVAPRIILGAMIGRWSFSTPPELTSLPGFFFGFGLRYGYGS